jgi:hypothetical protein
VRAALHAAVDEALDVAELELRAQLRGELTAGERFAGPPVQELTAWQGYAAELLELCERVLHDADDETARAFWNLLIEVAARNALRARDRREPAE